MAKKLIWIMIIAVLVIGLVAVAGFAFVHEKREGRHAAGTKDGFWNKEKFGSCQHKNQAGSFLDADKGAFIPKEKFGNCHYKNQIKDFLDADNDGICDNAANCPMHNAKAGCDCSGGCQGNTGVFTGTNAEGHTYVIEG